MDQPSHFYVLENWMVYHNADLQCFLVLGPKIESAFLWMLEMENLKNSENREEKFFNWFSEHSTVFPKHQNRNPQHQMQRDENYKAVQYIENEFENIFVIVNCAIIKSFLLGLLD